MADEFKQGLQHYAGYRTDELFMQDLKGGKFSNLESFLMGQLGRYDFEDQQKQVVYTSVFATDAQGHLNTQSLNQNQHEAHAVLSTLNSRNTAESKNNLEAYINTNLAAILTDMPEELRDHLVYSIDTLKANPPFHADKITLYREVKEGKNLLGRVEQKDPDAVRTVANKMKAHYDATYGDPAKAKTRDALKDLADKVPSISIKDYSLTMHRKQGEFEDGLDLVQFLRDAPEDPDYAKKSLMGIYESNFRKARQASQV